MPGNRVCLFMTQERVVMLHWAQKHRFPLLDTRISLFTACSPPRHPAVQAGVAESSSELFPEATATFLWGLSQGCPWRASC